MEVNIVVCDDESGIHRGLDALFEHFFVNSRQEYQIVYYTDPCKFLSRIREDRSVDIVFMDIDMPGMNGFDAAKKCGKYVATVLF